MKHKYICIHESCSNIFCLVSLLIFSHSLNIFSDNFLSLSFDTIYHFLLFFSSIFTMIEYSKSFCVWYCVSQELF